MSPKYWLMKAEPDSRIVKGKDVKFSVDDFESAKTTPWEGVRNAEARNLMKEMKIGDKVLFYHSNCKNPGIAAFAEVSKEAYPDYTAWDSAHPYFDAKTDKDNPKWYMVDVTFVSRVSHFVPLSLLRHITISPEPPEGVIYIGDDGVKAIKGGMALVTRGRLSVQRVEEEAWGAIEQLAKLGGWEEEGGFTGKQKRDAKPKPKPKDSSRQKSQMKAKAVNEDEGEDQVDLVTDTATPEAKKPSRKRKAVDMDTNFENTPRRSSRARR